MIGKVFNLYWIRYLCGGVEIHSSVVLAGRDGMNNNFKFKMNPISNDFHPQNWRQTKTLRTRFLSEAEGEIEIQGFNFNLRLSCPNNAGTKTSDKKSHD